MSAFGDGNRSFPCKSGGKRRQATPKKYCGVHGCPAALRRGGNVVKDDGESYGLVVPLGRLPWRLWADCGKCVAKILMRLVENEGNGKGLCVGARIDGWDLRLVWVARG
jgi:hypothetical protein